MASVAARWKRRSLLDVPSTESRERFTRNVWEAHAVHREMNRSNTHGAEEAVVVASLDVKFSTIEVDYVLAHRLTDLGRRDAAKVAAARARSRVDGLLADVRTLGEHNAKEFEAASAALHHRRYAAARCSGCSSRDRFVSIAVVMNTVRFIPVRSRCLIGHARSLSSGELSVRTTRSFQVSSRNWPRL